jgi:hypothetical protein
MGMEVERFTDNRSLGECTVCSSPPKVDAPMDKMCTVLWVGLLWICRNTQDTYCSHYPSTIVGLLILVQIDRFGCGPFSRHAGMKVHNAPVDDAILVDIIARPLRYGRGETIQE